MNTEEINNCLQYYADILNKDGGDIYVIEDKFGKYTIKGQYKRVSVENCGLVIETSNTYGSNKTVIRQFIPYHSIVKITSAKTVEV